MDLFGNQRKIKRIDFFDNYFLFIGILPYHFCYLKFNNNQ
jgi:hypothetical protein